MEHESKNTSTLENNALWTSVFETWQKDSIPTFSHWKLRESSQNKCRKWRDRRNYSVPSPNWPSNRRSNPLCMSGWKEITQPDSTISLSIDTVYSTEDSSQHGRPRSWESSHERRLQLFARPVSNRPLSTQDLADRWGVSSDLLASWRQHGIGPRFIQIGQLIRYPVTEVQSFEHQMESEPCKVKGIPLITFFKTQNKRIGKLRRSKFSEKKSHKIIETYLSQLFDPVPQTHSHKVVVDYVNLMTQYITPYDSDEVQFEGYADRVTPEVLCVDLINNLEKINALVNIILNKACNKLSDFETSELLRAVDNFGDMSTRNRINTFLLRDFTSNHR